MVFGRAADSVGVAAGVALGLALGRVRLARLGGVGRIVGTVGSATKRDAAIAAAESPLEAKPLAGFEPDRGSVIVDALFGAGLSKAIEGEVAASIEKCAKQEPR